MSLSFNEILNGSTDDLVPLAAFDDAQPGIPCRRTMERFHSRREGPPRIKIGRKVFYRKGALRDWILSLETEEVRAGGRG